MLLSFRSHRIDADPLLGTAHSLKGHNTIDFCEKSIVLAHPDIAAWMDLGSELSNEYVSGQHFLPAEALDPPPLAGAVAPVS